MRIFVTGGTGFIGSHIATHFHRQGHEVIVVGTKTEQTPEATRRIDLGILGIEAVLKTVGTIDICFHQAANNDTLDQDRYGMFASNVDAPMALFSTLYNRHGCKKFIYASSASVYGNSPIPYKEGETELNPLNPYAESKKEFDDQVMNFASSRVDTSVVGLRYTNVYGPGERHKGRRASMIYQLVNKMILGEKPKLFRDGNQKRDWIHVQDVLSANLMAVNYDKNGIFNCGYGDSFSFNQIIETINDKLETRLYPDWIDCSFATAYQTNTLADMTRAKEELNFVPAISPDQGIRMLVDDIRKAGTARL